MSAAPYRVPVVLAVNGTTLRVGVAPLPAMLFARPRVAGLLPIGAGRFVGEAARSDVPASGTVRGSPPSERPTCDGVNCESSLPWSVELSAPSVCSESALKVSRVGLSTRVGRRSGLGGLGASPNIPVCLRPMVVEGNKGPERPEADEGGEDLEGDNGGLATRCWGEGGDVAPVRDGVRGRSSVV
jgi:hypothetical protein